MRMTSREFNQNLDRAKRKSLRGPVIITDHGKPKHVLLSYEEYRFICANKPSSAYDWLCSLGHADVADTNLEIPARCISQRPDVELG